MKTPTNIFDELRERMDKFRPSRAQFSDFHQSFRRVVDPLDIAGPSMKSTEDFAIPAGDRQIPVRLYVPYGASAELGPTVIYFHGGGFVTGSIKSHETLCQRMACDSGFRVLSVEYRLAPKNPFPAAHDDCETVLTWAMQGNGEPFGIDAKRLIVSGDSAGGNVAAYLAQAYRRDLKAQILYYPLMQLISVKPPKPGPQDIIPIGTMALRFIKGEYVQTADPYDVRLSPLLERNLRGLPPAYVLTCGLDPLRDEGKAYAENLTAAGVPVKSSYERSMPHGFLNFAKAFPKARTIPHEVGDFLRKYVP